MEQRGTSPLARGVSNILVAAIGSAVVTVLLKALGMKRLALGAGVGVVMVLVHERLDTPLARLLSRQSRDSDLVGVSDSPT